MFEMKDRTLKNISTKELEFAIAELLTDKLGDNDFKVEIKNLDFRFNVNYETEMNIIINETAFDHTPDEYLGIDVGDKK